MRYIALLGILIFPLLGMVTDGEVHTIRKSVPNASSEQIRTTVVMAIVAIAILLAIVCPLQLKNCIARKEFVMFAANLFGFLIGLLGVALIVVLQQDLWVFSGWGNFPS